MDNLKIEIESVEDVNCIICKNSVENKIYGVCGYLYKSNLYEMCKIISNNNVLGIQNQNKYSWFFNSCNHKIHNSCFNEYSYD